MADDRTTRPPQVVPAAQGGDVGGIPSTLNQGVDHASDRSAGRREGTLESDAGGGMPPSVPVSEDSAALSSRPARDTTGSAVPVSKGSSAETVDEGSSTLPTDKESAAEAGNDDSLPESLGKAISEPFKSD